jgi:hypothetical protein
MAEKHHRPELCTPFWLAGAEEKAIVRRLFARAAERTGSASALAQSLGLPYTAIRGYLAGEALPPEDLMLRTLELIIEDLELKHEISSQAWMSLLPSEGEPK